MGGNQTWRSFWTAAAYVSVGADHKDSRGGRLLLISPYLKFNDKIKDLLEDQVQSWKTNVYVVYGKTELRAEETEWLDANFVRTSYREHCTPSAT